MKNAKRFVICSDIHGDEQDEKATASLLDFCKDFKPHIRVLNGDLWDFRNLRKGASDDEKAHSLEDDWQAGMEFASAYFKASPSANFFLRGNHDERLWEFANSASGLLRDYATDGIKRVEQAARVWKATMLPYDSRKGVLQLGKLRVIHGYHAGAGAAQAHARVYGNCVFGHTHSVEVNAIASLEPEEARGIGCLCKQDMGYVNFKTGKLRWAQGWGYGLLHEDGTYHLNQARKINGKFVCSSRFTDY
jgi:predicted phosphodiesterase